jgi:hypothetical protein
MVASGRSLSTVTIMATIDSRALWPTNESEEWSDSDRMGFFKLEAPFAMDPSTERTLENAAKLAAPFAMDPSTERTLENAAKLAA